MVRNIKVHFSQLSSHIVQRTWHITIQILQATRHYLTKKITHQVTRTTHRTSRNAHRTSHKISLTCRKCGLASAKPEAMLSDKYNEGLTQCCWINKKNRIVMTGRGSMAKDVAYDSFKLRTPVIRRWNTIIPAMILQKNKQKNTGKHMATCIEVVVFARIILS